MSNDGIVFTLHSPTTPGNPGYSVDLTNVTLQQGFRLGDLGGLTTECELGAVASSSARLDDPTGLAGAPGIPGLKQLSVNEARAPSGNRRIGEFYIGPRTYIRGGQAVSPSLRTGVMRVVDMDLYDINSFLSFRLLHGSNSSLAGSNTGFNRPAETDVARVLALLQVSYLSDTLFDGLVGTTSTVPMDAVDYTGQRPSDVMNDCAQQSGKNFFVFYDEAGLYTPSPGDYGLFYDFNTNPVYPAAVPAFQISNVLADVRGSNTTYAPQDDGQLIRDPARVVSGVFIQNGSNSVYRENPTTSYAFGWRDAVTSSPNLKTVAAMTSRADRYLAENATEDDRLAFTVKLPAANVNDWKEGQYASVKFSHLAPEGYGDFTQVRALVRTVMQSEETDQFYDVHYEVCKMGAGQPAGAFSVRGFGPADGPGIPTLLKPTTPGNVLLMIVVCDSNAVTSALGLPYLSDDPDPFHPPAPPFASDQASWTPLVSEYTNDSGAGGNYAISASILWRYVAGGEVTTTPVAVSSPSTPGLGGVGAWLWELPPTAVPVAGSTFFTPRGFPPAPPGNYSLPSTSGNALGVLTWRFGNTGGENADWTAVTGNTISSTQLNNDPTNYVIYGWSAPWQWIGQLPAGGVMTVNMGTVFPSVGYLSACGVTVTLPAGIVLPAIPFPGNQV